MPDIETYRHSLSHVMAQAVQRIFPGALLAIGPAIEDGFYYDFDLPRPLTPEDLEAIEAEMRRIIAADLPIVRKELSREEAEAFFGAAGQKYKVELIRELPEGEVVSTYTQGEFTALCTGPHLGRTGAINPDAFKLLSVAGAYWRGDERRPMLQRIYGTAFETEAELEAHLARLEEARRRDHRHLGRELDLYSTTDEVGAGFVLWHPKGGRVRVLIEDFWRREHFRRGYDIVFSPHIAKAELWRTSGHLQWYRENMYSGMNIDGVEYLVKPMNCPFHIMMYKSQTRSYRDLPLRWAELGTVYRYERSGALHGLLRVRGFTQDDAHIFCRPDQLESEVEGVIDLAVFMLRSFGFDRYEMELSLSDPEHMEKYAGSPERWREAESVLERILVRRGETYRKSPGEAAFYGPKIDIKLIDALGRGWQGPTIQFDFNLPERFDLTYMGEDGQLHRPYMVHRTVLGSMERFLGSLIEHHGGAFPVWLAPVQARILPVADRHLDYAERVRNRLTQEGLRVEVDGRNEKVSWKIRQAQLEKVPYMLVVGDREQESGAVAVRHRSEGDLGARPLEEFAARLAREAAPPG
ncbi:MAG: threonine--tRNA ligase [Firmicutes bacterium]|nr:threonine--tRNA ligase [Bacillota bacterium]